MTLFVSLFETALCKVKLKNSVKFWFSSILAHNQTIFLLFLIFWLNERASWWPPVSLYSKMGNCYRKSDELRVFCSRAFKTSYVSALDVLDLCFLCFRGGFVAVLIFLKNLWCYFCVIHYWIYKFFVLFYFSFLFLQKVVDIFRKSFNGGRLFFMDDFCEQFSHCALILTIILRSLDQDVRRFTYLPEFFLLL